MHLVKALGRISGTVMLLFLWTASGAADRNPSFPGHVQIDDQKINDDTGTANQSRPAIAMHKGGLTVVAWPDNRNGVTDIYFQLFNRRGLAYGTLGNVKVNDAEHENVLHRCDVAMDGYGNFLIAWDAGSGSESHAYGQWYYANGRPKGGNFRIDEGAGAMLNGGVSLADVDSGGAVAVWVDRRNNANGEIMLQVYGKNGNPSGPASRVNPGLGSGMLYAAVDVSPGGKGWVVWQADSGIVGDKIMACDFDARTGAAGTVREIAPKNDPAVVRCTGPVVAAGANGGAAVFWMTDFGDGVIRRQACLLDPDGNPAAGPFFVDEDDKFGFQGELAVFSFINGSYVFLWSGNSAGNWDIYIRSCNAAGETIGASSRVNDPDGLQFGPNAATDGSGIIQIVWYDRRNGMDFDVYGTRLTAGWPMAVTAGSGFDGRVPISWEPPFGGANPTRYLIYRSESAEGEKPLLATVDLATRPFPDRMRDFIDFTAENGRSYYYSVRSDIAGSPGATVGPVTPAAGGHVILSAWCAAPPTVDGFLALGEWLNSTEIPLSEPSGYSDNGICVMNDTDSLYIAVWDMRDTNAEAASTLALLFDTNHDGVWPAAGPSEEGLVAVMPAGMGFLGYWGTYPEGLGGNAAVAAVSGRSSISNGGGRVQYECALSLSDPPDAFAPGGTVGFAAALSDPGNFYAHHYGYAGEWPLGALWEAAESLGHLILASGPDAVDSESELPSGFALGRNYPNPFNPLTTVPFRVREAGRVTLKVYDALGDEVAVLVNGRFSAGNHTARLDASGLASGIYVIRMQAEGFTASRKIALVK